MNSNTQKQNEFQNTDQEKKYIKMCTQNLNVIGKAVKSYLNDNKDYPEWLSDLHPKYLQDTNILICPADKENGEAFFSFNEDKKLSISYDYQFHPEYREEKSEQRLIYGDAMPLVRCRHHKNDDFDCLNLSFAFEVFTSSGIWEYAPEEMYGSSEKAIVALEAGLKHQPINEHVAEMAYTTLVRLYMDAGRMEEATEFVSYFRRTMKQDNLQTWFLLGELLEMTNQQEELLSILEQFEEQYPDDRNLLQRLAHVNKKLGNTEIAAVYERKSEPKYDLWGKVVPDFSTTDLDGKPISLQQYRGKVVLLEFWGAWCGFCNQELPNIKKVYNSYRDQGFDIIGVSLDDEAAVLREYIKENDIQWRQISSGKRWEEDPLATQFEVTGLPEQWLIDRDGKLISHNARGEELESLVLEALKINAENR